MGGVTHGDGALWAQLAPLSTYAMLGTHKSNGKHEAEMSTQPTPVLTMDVTCTDGDQRALLFYPASQDKFTKEHLKP